MTGGGTIAVTGATGLVGSHLCAHFHRRGWDVRALVRDPRARPCPIEGVESRICSLPETIDRAAFAGARALVHCAWATRESDPEKARRVNEEGTARLLEAARAAGVERFVFVSSVSARADSPAYYGRSKHAVERLLDPERDLVVRPGLVLADRGGGLFLRLRGTLAGALVVPVFGGGVQVMQTVHVADLCAALERALERGLTGTLHLAEPEGPTYRELLRGIARRLGRRPLFLPVPFAPALLALRACEALRLPLPVGSENLLGLRALRAVPSAADLERLGLALRSASESLDDLLGPLPGSAREASEP